MLRGHLSTFCRTFDCQNAIAKAHDLELQMIELLDFGILACAVRRVAHSALCRTVQ